MARESELIENPAFARLANAVASFLAGHAALQTASRRNSAIYRLSSASPRVVQFASTLTRLPSQETWQRGAWTAIHHPRSESAESLTDQVREPATGSEIALDIEAARTVIRAYGPRTKASGPRPNGRAVSAAQTRLEIAGTGGWHGAEKRAAAVKIAEALIECAEATKDFAADDTAKALLADVLGQSVGKGSMFIHTLPLLAQDTTTGLADSAAVSVGAAR